MMAIAKAKLITPEGQTILLLPQDYQIVMQALAMASPRFTTQVAALHKLVKETCGKYATGIALTEVLLQERAAERARGDYRSNIVATL